MACSAEDSRSISKDLSLAREVDGVTLATADLREVALLLHFHVFSPLILETEDFLVILALVFGLVSIVEGRSVVFIGHIVISVSKAVHSVGICVVHVLRWETLSVLGGRGVVEVCSVRALRAMGRVAEALSLLDLLVHRHLILSSVVLILLVKRSHSKLLMRKCLVLPSGGAVVGSGSVESFLLAWLDCDETLAYGVKQSLLTFKNVHLV